jgi:ATP-dependent DNA helicase PIF1
LFFNFFGYSCINLKDTFRQKDLQFIGILNEIRFGSISPASLSIIRNLMRKPIVAKEGVEPTRLISRNADADKINEEKLHQLNGDVSYKYVAKDFQQSSDSPVNLDISCRFKKELELRVGAQVMLLTNSLISKGLANGSKGGKAVCVLLTLNS